MTRATASRDHRAVALAGVVYALLVAIIWGAFNLRSGLPYETSFPHASETRGALQGFVYDDPLRLHSRTFYQLSYLVGEALGIGGSYTPFQVVYALLWWARGFLTLLIMRAFLPRQLGVGYAAGALVLTHASDGTLLWVGQMNQLGFIFWMLLAFYCLTLAVGTAHRARVIALGLAACVFEYLSLFSYESQILLLIAFPPLLLLTRGHRGSPRLGALTVAWYAIPALYVAATWWKYTRGAGEKYQLRVIRASWDPGAFAGDWWFNIRASLEFWGWARGEWLGHHAEAVILSVIAAAVFVAGGVALARLSSHAGGPSVFDAPAIVWWHVLGAGFVLLVLSVPVYLLLDSARSLWRTQLLSGIGAGLVLTATGGLLSRAGTGRQARFAGLLLFGAVVVYFGSESAIQKGAFHRLVWDRHREAMLEILRIAPSVKPETVIVVVNVPKRADPFIDASWLSLALRLSYPRVPVAGVYFYEDGTPGPGTNLTAEGDRWRWDGTGHKPVVAETRLSRTLIVRYDPSGTGAMLTTMPPFICRARCAMDLYDPAAVISGPISPRTVRRYRME